MQVYQNEIKSDNRIAYLNDSENMRMYFCTVAASLNVQCAKARVLRTLITEIWGHKRVEIMLHLSEAPYFVALFPRFRDRV